MINEESEGYEALRTFAIQNDAEDARIIPVSDIVVAEWPRWKCQFGCPNYGKSLMCPPNSPTPNETRALLKDYRYAMLMKYDSTKDHHKRILELERRAFLSGLPQALVMTAGRCRICEKCSDSLCLHPEQARPSMEACGIDVFSTARKAGFEMSVKGSKDESYHRFCLLLLK